MLCCCNQKDEEAIVKRDLIDEMWRHHRIKRMASILTSCCLGSASILDSPFQCYPFPSVFNIPAHTISAKPLR
jgi:hypothetical protein